MKNIVRLNLPEKCRIIAVSDIHTCWYLLDTVLKKADYRPNEDYLIIVGDILEHWDQNLQTLKYVMELCRNNRVYCLMGNNDTTALRMAHIYNYEEFIQKRSRKPHNTFMQMAERLGITDFPKLHFDDLRKKVCSHFKAELEFLENLPYALETQNHIFVHAGIENRVDWQNTSETFALTHPYWLREKQCSGKCVVVGHFPCYNYKRANNTNLPIVDDNEKMICIDGGLTVKHACQLNAFCINKDGGSYFCETIWDTFFDKKIVIEDYYSNMTPLYCDPYNHEFTFIGKKDGLALVRNETTGQEGSIPEEKLWFDNGRLKIWYSINAFISVKKGEVVSLCDINGIYAFIIAENGQVGWIPKNIIE